MSTTTKQKSPARVAAGRRNVAKRKSPPDTTEATRVSVARRRAASQLLRDAEAALVAAGATVTWGAPK